MTHDTSTKKPDSKLTLIVHASAAWVDRSKARRCSRSHAPPPLSLVDLKTNLKQKIKNTKEDVKRFRIQRTSSLTSRVVKPSICAVCMMCRPASRVKRCSESEIMEFYISCSRGRDVTTHRQSTCLRKQPPRAGLLEPTPSR